MTADAPAQYSFNSFNNSAYFGLPPSLPAQIAAAAGAGYPLIGLDVPSILAHEAEGIEPAALRDELNAQGLRCYEIVPLSLSADRHAAVEGVRTLCRLAAAVEAQHVLATVRAETDANVVDNFRMAVDALSAIGVRLSVEFMPTSPLATLEAAIELLDAVDDDRLGIVIDIWHLILSGSRWSTLQDLSLDRIGFLQLDDATVDAVGTSTEDSLHHRVLPGEGVFTIARLRDAVAEKGYTGVVSVEVLSHEWRQRPIDEFAQATLAATRQAWERRSFWRWIPGL